MIEELEAFLKKPVGDKIVPDDDEKGDSSSTYRYLNILKSVQLIVGKLPREEKAESEGSEASGGSEQNEGGSQEAGEKSDEEMQSQEETSGDELDLSQ